MKIVTVIGARPQIIKASALSRVIQDKYSERIDEVIVHTGQHYDDNMSEIFFRQLNIPSPVYNLHAVSTTHGGQISLMTAHLEEIILKESPDAVVLYGDTNSTLAGALAASKINVPIAHIEAGLRSFDKTMPEEINRILCDNVSTLLFCPTLCGYNNLLREGFSNKITPRPDINHPNIYHCGDIMYDNTLFFRKEAESRAEYRQKYGKDFILCTVHRNTNTDDTLRLANICKALLVLAENKKIILPLHPRTRKKMNEILDVKIKNTFFNAPNIIICDPVGYLEMVYLENNASIVITDSGGVQKEAYFLNKPCVVLRPYTEWIEIAESGCSVLADDNTDLIVDSVNNYSENGINDFPSLFGDGKAAEFICQTIFDCL